jgi:KaiC/GvpD/RAD55 family RecA-like ATPase
MTGEVFTAVIGGDARRAARAGADPEALEAERERLDEYRGALREYEAMLRTRAVTEGQTFGTYEPPKRRRRRKERSDAESTVALGPAMDAMRDRRFEDAVRILRESIEDDDANPRTWILLGEASLRLGRRFDAASAFHRSLDLSPADERGWLGLGRSLREVGELPAALASLDRAVAINPSSADAWSERGAILEALANLSEALRCYAKALELRPDSTTARARRSDLEGRLLADAKEHGRLPAPAGPASPEGTVEATPEAAAETASESESAAPPSADRAIDEILGLADVGVRSTPAKAPEPASAGEAGPVAGAGVRPAEPVPRPAKVRTYIDGLDDALDGGIPWGHVVLVQGTPGTMKSSVSFAILLKNAAEEGRHGLYVTLEERSESLLRQMASLGLPARVDRGSLVFLDPHSAKELLRERADWIPGLERAIEAIQAQRGLDLLVIDSLEALEVLAKFKDRRREIFRLFEWLRDLGVTSFVITERPDWVVGGHVVLGRWDEDFLADGLIQLRLHNVSDLDVQRRIRVMKMRGTKHEAGYFAFVLDDGRFRVTRAMSP